MKLKISIIICALLIGCSNSYGQLKSYSYKREIMGIREQWHKVILPDDIFGKTANDLRDIRVFGITPDKDTLEAPYLMQLKAGKSTSKEIPFKLLNISNNDNGYYFTFEIPATEPINQIKLHFTQKNFDWLIKLEGSQNQLDWFNIADNYRILSIKNVLTDFQFTNLVFPDSKYRYYRLFINSKEQPDITVASIAQHEITEGIFRDYPIKRLDIKQNKPTKQTEIEIELQKPVPISHLKIAIKDSFDYYRSLTIKYLSDSVKTAQNWQYHYSTLTSGTLNSIEKNIFSFSSTTAQKLKIFIDNQDNQPLNIDSIQVKGYEHELLVRFTEPATYFLAYGSLTAAKPNYDIDRFTDKAPLTMTAVELDNELVIEKEKVQLKDHLFKNQTLLWTIMGLIILVLGWFSLRMIRKK